MAVSTLPRSARRHAYRVLVAVVALSVLVPAVTVSAGENEDRLERRQRRTEIEIGDVEQRLAELRETIAAEQRASTRLQVQIAEAARGLAGAQRAFDETQQQLMALRTELAVIEEEHAEIQARLADRALVALEMSEGPAALEFVLESESLTEAGDRLEFLNQMQVADDALADEAAVAAEMLDRKRRLEQSELARQVELVEVLDTEEERLAAALVDQQWRLDAIADAKQEARRLLSQLSARAEQLAEKEFSVPGDGGATFGTWAKSFLQYIDAPTCSDNVVILVTWQVAEFTEARWNPLATTLDMPNASVFNSHGVRNYVSLEQGLEATHQTLLRGAETYGYGAVLQGLKRCADRMVTANAIRASSWCAGCASGAYVTGLVPIVERYWERYANATAWG